MQLYQIDIIRQPLHMKEDLMEVVAILDMSGSMERLTMDTIAGFNSYVEELKKMEGEVRHDQQHHLEPKRQLFRKPNRLPAARRTPGLDGRHPVFYSDRGLQF